jgi:hypothetical protein
MNDTIRASRGDAAATDAKRLIVVTATYERPGRLCYLQRFAAALLRAGNIFWILVEDDERTHASVQEFLAKISVPHCYITAGRTGDMGNTPKNIALQLIHKMGMSGIIYIADDDNYYQPQLWPELRRTVRVGVLPVGNLGPHGIERPVVENGKITAWDSGWTSRTYPLDWAGLCFSSEVLNALAYPYIGRRLKGEEQSKFTELDVPTRKRILAADYEGESEFIDRIVSSKDELQLLCNQCRDCYVWYNWPLTGRAGLITAKCRKLLKRMLRS